MEPTFFATPEDFCAWLEAHHDTEAELLAAFERRSDDRTAIYSYEQRKTARLDAERERRFRANPAAWNWFRAQPAGYRRTASYWVISAKRSESRERRLEQLIADSAAGRTIPSLTPPSRPGASRGAPT